jgi:2-haloacid dehalogenase
VTVLDLTTFKALTFDCYGTLIDWESGILETLAPFRGESSLNPTDDEVLERYALAESNVQAGGYRRYRDVLAEVMKEMASYLAIQITEYDVSVLANSVAYWRPFPDTVDALRKLKQRYQLVILSNIDDNLFAFSAAHLQVPFDHVVTAEQVGSYKPSHNNFKAAIETLGLPNEEILHVAQSLYHDIKPANELGLTNVWVNRRTSKKGFGATRKAEARPTLEVPDMESLAELVESAFEG